MSLLASKDDSTLTTHDAPSGESYTRGSSHLLSATVAAFVLVTAAIVIFLLVNRKPPVAAGEVTQVWAHSVHTLNTPMDANGVQSAGEEFNQVLVFANVRVRNQSDQPIVLREMMTNVTLDDGPRSSYVATATDYNRIFIAYPQLAGLKGKTLTRDTVIQPGEVLDGSIVSSFHATKEQWAGRKDLSFSLLFKFHPDLVLVPTAPVIEQ
jgi:hypothetical protein